MNSTNQSRRDFLRTASALGAVVPAAGAGFALNLATIGAAAAQSAPGDYKALVCVFMFGGCDYANTVLATDASNWNGYLAARGQGADPIALDLPGAGTPKSVLAIAPDNASGFGNVGNAFALHPSLAKMKTLFDANRAAVVANVGPLIVPTSKLQYDQRSVPRPASLFSHNDQQSTWMAFGPEGAARGWGGRMGDLFAASNQNPVFTNISATGNEVFLVGNTSVQYQVSTNGAVGINALNNLFNVGAGPAALQGIVTESRAHLIEREVNRVTARSIDARTVMNNAVSDGNTALGASASNVPANNGLASQLSVVAKIIGGRATTGANRQVFMVGIGGFDNHDGLVARHAGLMTQIANAVEWFDGAMTALNARDKVTLFTASDFGRTLTSNGDGSDHGWGSHHFVVGGAVKGKDIYGRFPAIGTTNNDQVGQGRLLPTVSVDQYAATLAKWFGLSDAQMLDVMPNLKNFSQKDLGFML